MLVLWVKLITVQTETVKESCMTGPSITVTGTSSYNEKESQQHELFLY